ncbi:ABC transporter ATP-binding protein [Paracoccus sp. R12_1]|uniref:ABC transporter ATP-binding protein n=1 Tax=unclassified Paracoccus (in: a-proteobacteria) TaxID=2688777 RepID=UPI001AD9E63C|nr:MULTISPECIES: ABC transporter ATP-binding protein [unclassified Paracoccus (in: a-proteobacteria)]MBO9455716.1 ABC transporter ATP-binding protein [Paracoccus sp. R12_2]MBO9487149.1 ABC transporter ATP-binding protein [Paracoccus sp. R12_1]
MSDASDTILSVKGLSVSFGRGPAAVTALRDVSFNLERGRTLALVGESGSGKSVTSLALMGLLPPSGRVRSGRLDFRGRDGSLADLAGLDAAGFRRLRGPGISMIFQEPMSSLNPLFTIGDQIGEMLFLHENMPAAQRRKRVIEMLELVEIPGAAARVDAYPHELSGGMRQRVMIAMGMICNPALLIADEPTTALDVTIQAQILDLMRRLQRDLGMSILFITHDMGVVAEMADDVAVMYAGAVVEQAGVMDLFDDTRHPYTQGLLNSIPREGLALGERLVPIPGTVPPLTHLPPGCAFAPRCPHARPECRDPVALKEKAPGHLAACVLDMAVPA